MIGYGIIRQIAVRRARTASPVISRESTTVAAQIAGNRKQHGSSLPDTNPCYQLLVPHY
jgi:hypothetical protein